MYLWWESKCSYHAYFFSACSYWENNIVFLAVQKDKIGTPLALVYLLSYIQCCPWFEHTSDPLWNDHLNIYIYWVGFMWFKCWNLFPFSSWCGLICNFVSMSNIDFLQKVATLWQNGSIYPQKKKWQQQYL